MVSRAAVTLLAVAALGALLWAPGRRPAGAGAPAAAPPAPAGGAAAPAAGSAAAPAADAQPNAFFAPEQFYKGLRQAQELPAVRRAGGEGARAGGLAGGLVPHHALAGVMFSAFFLELEERQPDTVFVVGPNHENKGARIITGRRAWATDFGQVEADGALVDSLVQSRLAVLDDDVLASEHAIGALMPYLKYHTPAARVVPVIVHKGVTLGEVRALADFLAPLLGPERLLVASVDFSHYLTRAEAEAKDEVTWQAIQDFDLPALLRMGPDHLDSPAALSLLMVAMQKLGAAGPEVVAHTNSGVLLGNDHIETTSYFTLKYRVNP